MTPQISKSENGIDFDILVDGAKVGHILDLRPFPGKCPFHACLATPGRPSIGVFPTIEEAAAGIAEAHARRIRRNAPTAAKPAPATVKPPEPVNEDRPKLVIVPSKEFPATNSAVHFEGEVIGKIAKLPAYDGRPFHAMHLIRYVSGVPEFAQTGLFASREEAAREIHQRWAAKRAKGRDRGRE